MSTNPSAHAVATATRTTPRRPAALDPQALQEWLAGDDRPRLLDVRTPAEFTTAHIPGSYNVPLPLLREHRDELRSHLDDDVVLVCRSGARATQAEALLGSTGLANLHVLTGGVSAWEASGGPLNRGAQTWELERQVRLVAGGIVLSGVLASTKVPALKWVSAAIGAGLTGAAVTNSCAMGGPVDAALQPSHRPQPRLGAARAVQPGGLRSERATPPLGSRARSVRPGRPEARSGRRG